MEAALDRFVAAGWDLAVCTNKLEGLSLQLLDALGLTQRFAAICGGDTFPVRKPDPAHLLGTIERAGGDPKRSVMVGDSGTDIATARAAGIPVVAFTFGYTDKPVAEYHPPTRCSTGSTSSSTRWRRSGSREASDPQKTDDLRSATVRDASRRAFGAPQHEAHVFVSNMKTNASC